MRLLERLRQLDASSYASQYCAFFAAGRCVGQVQRTLLPLLLGCKGSTWMHPPVFYCVTLENGSRGICLAGGSTEQRTAGMNVATDALIEAGLVTKRHGDLYPLASEWGEQSVALVDRNAAPFFGVTSVGVHLLCFVYDVEGAPRVWMAQRAATKANFPNLWDPTVAGGQPDSLTIRANVKKEAAEEAGVSASLVVRARASGALSQMTAKPDGSCLKQSLYFVYDLLVPIEFAPKPVDGEVQRFELWSAAEIEAEVRSGERLRPAMRLVMADFLIRHGVIDPDSEGRDYLELQRAMKQPRLVLGVL